MPLLFLLAEIASPSVPAQGVGRATVTIMPGAEVHFAARDRRDGPPLERKQVRGEDGIARPALLVEFQ